MNDLMADVLEVLEAVRDELDNRADAEYTSEGGQIGNWAMNLMADVDRVIAKVERLQCHTEVANAAAVIPSSREAIPLMRSLPALVRRVGVRRGMK